MELGDDVLEAVYADPGSAPVSDRLKAGLALVERFTLHPDELGRGDIPSARAPGLTDADIVDVLDAAAEFAVLKRISDSLDFNVFE